jgi:hypothetical protein
LNVRDAISFRDYRISREFGQKRKNTRETPPPRWWSRKTKQKTRNPPLHALDNNNNNNIPFEKKEKERKGV